MSNLSFISIPQFMYNDYGWNVSNEMAVKAMIGLTVALIIWSIIIVFLEATIAKTNVKLMLLNPVDAEWIITSIILVFTYCAIGLCFLIATIFGVISIL